MAYRRRYRRRGGGRRNRHRKAQPSSWMTTAQQVGNTAYKAWNLATKIARMVNVEYKYNYLAINADAISTSGQIYQIQTPAQGDGPAHRDGISIKCIRLSGRIGIQLDPSATTPYNSMMRLILFRGKNEDQSTPAVSDILDSTATTPYLASKPPGGDKYRTKIIYDKLYQLSANGTQQRVLNWNFKLYGHTTFASGSTNIENGGLWLLAISSTLSSAKPPLLSAELKFTYTDN